VQHPVAVELSAGPGWLDARPLYRQNRIRMLDHRACPVHEFGENPTGPSWAGEIPMDAAEILDQLTHAEALPKPALQAASEQRAEMARLSRRDRVNFAVRWP